MALPSNPTPAPLVHSAPWAQPGEAGRTWDYLRDLWQAGSRGLGNKYVGMAETQERDEGSWRAGGEEKKSK